MKSIHKLMVMMLALVFACGCGGGGSSEIDGPTLSISEATSMVIDQVYINGGMGDEYSSNAEFSVYLRDAATGMDVACTTAEDGMAELSTAGVYYGGLSVPLHEVKGDHPSEMARFQLVFVEQDSEGCPGPIDDEDDIAGISAEFMFEGLLGKQIWATNGLAVAVLRNRSEEEKSIKSMAPALADGLSIDKIFFNNDSDAQETHDYYIFVDQVEDGRSVYQCQVDDDLMGNIRYGDIVYSVLGFPISCFSATDQGFDDISVRVGLYIQKDTGTQLVGETEPTQIGDLIGEMASFTNGKGYVSFQSVITTPFAAPVVRLGELTSLMATSLTYELTPSYNPTVELHLANSGGDYIIACAGEEQGLVGVDVPGTYEGLDGSFVAAEGQKELFGWNEVLLRLVDRRDGLSCPAPLSAEATVLATTDALSSGDLNVGTIEFENGAGIVTLSIAP